VRLARIKISHGWALIAAACVGGGIGVFVGPQLGLGESVAGGAGAAIASALVASLLGVQPFEREENK
jgi:hypothetical protein